MGNHTLGEQQVSGLSAKALLDALPQQIAVLDERCRIVAVNTAWIRLVRTSGFAEWKRCEGRDYLGVCEFLFSNWEQDCASVGSTLREIAKGTRPSLHFEGAWVRSEEPRWFTMDATGFLDDGRSRLLVVHRDITEEREAAETFRLNEERLNSLLELFQKSTDLAENEIIQLALEEAEKLTSSAIGYCHLVHEEQEEIELVTWSRATAGYCDAVHEKHYPMSQAGIWADCARIKAPVVHNDYRNLEQKKGLPEGHSELIRHVSVPVVEDGVVRLIMGVGNKAVDYDEPDVRQLQLVANDAWQIVRRRRLETELQILAMTDALTGLYNRRFLFDRGAAEIQRVHRYGGSVSVLMLDIDSFKMVNDLYGHAVGDRVLHEISDAMKASLREVDVIGRVGGEEFAVLLPNTDHEMALSLAGRLVERIRALRVTNGKGDLGVTVSVGAATLADEAEMSFEDLLKQADDALYRAKEAGRDCVVG